MKINLFLEIFRLKRGMYAIVCTLERLFFSKTTTHLFPPLNYERKVIHLSQIRLDWHYPRQFIRPCVCAFMYLLFNIITNTAAVPSPRRAASINKWCGQKKEKTRERRCDAIVVHFLSALFTPHFPPAAPFPRNNSIYCKNNSLLFHRSLNTWYIPRDLFLEKIDVRL